MTDFSKLSLTELISGWNEPNIQSAEYRNEIRKRAARAGVTLPTYCVTNGLTNGGQHPQPSHEEVLSTEYMPAGVLEPWQMAERIISTDYRGEGMTRDPEGAMDWVHVAYRMRTTWADLHEPAMRFWKAIWQYFNMWEVKRSRGRERS
jgi:hypothetical protein